MNRENVDLEKMAYRLRSVNDDEDYLYKKMKSAVDFLYGPSNIYNDGAKEEEIIQNGGEAKEIFGDLSKLSNIPLLANSIIEAWGRVDIMINNAATISPMSMLGNLDIVELEKSININQLVQDSLSQKNIADSVDDNVLSFPLKEAREKFEKNYLASQLKKHKGNISKTAEFIGMERSALHRKLKGLGVKDLN